MEHQWIKVIPVILKYFEAPDQFYNTNSEL